MADAWIGRPAAESPGEVGFEDVNHLGVWERHATRREPGVAPYRVNVGGPAETFEGAPAAARRERGVIPQ